MIVRAHWSFWLVGALALLWHLGALMNLFMQMNPEMAMQMPESHQAVANARPLWASFIFFISAFSGVLGAVALLAKHRICGPLFFLSFVTALIAVFQALVTGGALTVFSGVELLLAVAGPIVVGAFLVMYAHRVRKRGWLKRKADV